MEKKVKAGILCLIPIFLLFAIDGIFSVQSILPLVAVSLFCDCVQSNYKIAKEEVIVYILFFMISLLALLTNLVISPQYITGQSYIRIVYYAVIIYFYYSMTHAVYSKKDIVKAIYALIGVGCFVSIYFIFVEKIWFISFFGTRIDKNFIGVFLMTAATFSLYFSLTNKRKRWLFLLIYILLLVGIFFSASRASVLYCLMATLITITVYLKQCTKSRKGFIKAILMMYCLPPLLIICWLVLQSKMTDSAIDISWYWNRYFVNGFGDSSVTGRVMWWKEAILHFIERPIYGFGIGNISFSGNSSAVSHNTYIDFLVDQGIIGFLVFMNFIKKSVEGIFKNRQSLFYGIVFCVLIGIFNLSATRSTYLWFMLILLFEISRNDWNESNELNR